MRIVSLANAPPFAWIGELTKTATIFGNPSFKSLATSNTTAGCSKDIGSGSYLSAWVAPFPTEHVGHFADMSIYLNALKTAIPLLLVTWQKNPSATVAPVETAFVCLTPDQVLPGSVSSAAPRMMVQRWILVALMPFLVVSWVMM